MADPAKVVMLDDSTKIIFTAITTTMFGLVALIVGQVINKWILDPVHELRKLIGEVGLSIAVHSIAGQGADMTYLKRIAEAQNWQNIQPNENRVTQLTVERNELLLRAEWQKTDAASECFRTISVRLRV